jgi:Ca-activated chloride channel family protein
MNRPTIELLPLRPAVRSDSPTTLDVLVRITPPVVEPSSTRPTLNLALVLDRSGSMGAENKLAFAREAAAFVVGELAPTDRVSLTVFDHNVQTLAPNAPAANREPLLRLIAGVRPGGNTALHGGWAEGAKQVGDNVVPGGLNRVLLLSDGLANVGEARPDAIATDVHARRTAGVSTSTLGLGNDYNEDLLEGMARSGDGNYYYVESPAQLATIFRTELNGLTATAGTDVLLAVEPGPGVAAAEVLNELDRAEDGRLRLPNLVSGFPVLVALRLTVPPAAGERRICAVRLDWSAPGGERADATAGLTLPAVDAAAYSVLAPDLDVQERATLLLVARIKKKATQALDRYEPEEARRLLREAQALLRTIPATAEVGLEIQSLAEIDAEIERGEYVATSKRAKYDHYNLTHSKPRRRSDDQT